MRIEDGLPHSFIPAYSSKDEQKVGVFKIHNFDHQFSNRLIPDRMALPLANIAHSSALIYDGELRISRRVPYYICNRHHLLVFDARPMGSLFSQPQFPVLRLSLELKLGSKG